MVGRRLKLMAALSAVVLMGVVAVLSKPSASARAAGLAMTGTPASATSAGVQTGAALYMQKCAGCHGKNGKGMPMWKDKGQPDFTSQSFQSSHTDRQLSDSITNGKGKFMPAFKNKLSADQIASLVTQVRAFGQK